MTQNLLKLDLNTQDLKDLLDGLKLNVTKSSKRNSQRRQKILTYNSGFIQYGSMDEFIKRIDQQSTQKLSDQAYTFTYGYYTYKAGVKFSIFQNNEDQIDFGWRNNSQTQFSFIFNFLIKQKITYNPNIQKQKEQKEKKNKSPNRIIRWQFNVDEESEINRIKYRIVEIKEKKKLQQKHKICDKFIEQFDEMAIQIQSSESLEIQLQKFLIEIKFLGYISNKLKSNTNKNLVNADIIARCLYQHLTQLNTYQNNKVQIIEDKLKELYSGEKRTFDQNVLKIASEQFQCNIQEKDFMIVDVLLLNAMMYHFQFSIDLNVSNFIFHYGGFYQSINFSSVQDLSNKQQQLISHKNDMNKSINYENFLKIQEEQQNKDLDSIERYCVGLFGEKNQYLGIFYMELYKKQKKKDYLEKAQTYLVKSLNNAHQLIQQVNELKIYHKDGEENNNHKNSENISLYQFSNMQQSKNQKEAQNSQQDKKRQDSNNNQQHLYLDQTYLTQNSHNHQQQQQQQLQQSQQQQSNNPNIQQINLVNNKIQEQANTKSQYCNEPIKNLDIEQNQVQEGKKGQDSLFLFTSVTKSTVISRSSQTREEYQLQVAEENYNKGNFYVALATIDHIQNKNVKALRLGFLIEKQIDELHINNYIERLFQHLVIYGFSEKDCQVIEEILQLRFKKYVQVSGQFFMTNEWRSLFRLLKTRQFSSPSKIIIVNDIINTIRQKQYNDIEQYLKALISEVNPENRTQGSSQGKMKVQLDQFQLISKLYSQNS